MIRLLTATVTMLVLALGCFVSNAHAQSGPITPTAPKIGPSGPANAEEKLTEERLIARLAKLDANYKVFPRKNANGEEIGKMYRVLVDHNGLKYCIDFNVSRGAIWMQSNLAKIALKDISAEQLRSMLTVQVATGPSHFQYYDSIQMLALCHRVDRDITVARFNSALQEYLGDLDNSKSVWMPMLQANVR